MSDARAFVLAASGVLLLAACGPRPSDAAPGRGLLVIVVDGLRADHVSALGYDRPTTPVIDALADKGAIFSDAWAASPEVLPSHTALLTGCDPGLAHRPSTGLGGPATDLTNWLVPERLPSLAQELLADGFETAAFVDHPAVAPIRGVAKGFQTFQGFREFGEGVEQELAFEGVGTKFMNWLQGRSIGADWFAYIEVNDLERTWSRPALDPFFETFAKPRAELAQVPPVAEGEHAFFAVPRPRWSRGAKTLGEYEARYDGAVREFDLKLKKLLERLDRNGRLRTTTVVLVGAFGISFGEGGLILDTGALTAADLHVPWVIRPAENLSMLRGATIDGVVSLVDLAPTLLELHGLRVPAGMQGVSHAASLVTGAPTARAIAYASGGFQRGIAAIEPHWILARERPADAPTELLVRSWYGGPPPRASDGSSAPIERLVSRADDASLDASASAARERLTFALDAWGDWVERSRALLHSRIAPADDPKTAADLRRRGLIGPAR